MSLRITRGKGNYTRDPLIQTNYGHSMNVCFFKPLSAKLYDSPLTGLRHLWFSLLLETPAVLQDDSEPWGDTGSVFRIVSCGNRPRTVGGAAAPAHRPGHAVLTSRSYTPAGILGVPLAGCPRVLQPAGPRSADQLQWLLS